MLHILNIAEFTLHMQQPFISSHWGIHETLLSLCKSFLLFLLALCYSSCVKACIWKVCLPLSFFNLIFFYDTIKITDHHTTSQPFYTLDNLLTATLALTLWCVTDYVLCLMITCWHSKNSPQLRSFLSSRSSAKARVMQKINYNWKYFIVQQEEVLLICELAVEWVLDPVALIFL